MRISVIGDGGWGTALALLLHSKGLEVTMWGNFPDYIERMRQKRENVKFLPGCEIPESIRLTADFEEALQETSLIVNAVPTQFVRPVFERLKTHYPGSVPVLSVAKGLEQGRLLRNSEIILSILGEVPIAALSGPSHAEEVVVGVPTAVTVAGADRTLVEKCQDVFITERFRVYTSTDIVGTEVAGALKNIIAIAAGMCDGLGLGDNTKSALLTRGISEMARLGAALGASRETFSGLAGIGDLITTSFSRHGRNRAVGEAIGGGATLQQALDRMEKVAEGVFTTVAARDIAQSLKIEMPITEQVYQVLYKDKSPQQAVVALMTRKKKEEFGY